MKYIKLFESYKEIDVNELQKLSVDTFTGRDIYSIVNCISDTPIIYQKKGDYVTLLLPLSLFMKKRGGFVDKDNDAYSNLYREIFAIYKHTDEWFTVIDHSSSKFYRCDQIDGLVECIKERLKLWK